MKADEIKPLTADDVRQIVNQALSEHIDALTANFATKSEVAEAFRGARDYTDEAVAKEKGETLALIERVNKALETVNCTIDGLNGTILTLNTTVAGLNGKMAHFGSITNQLVSRQDAQSREQDYLRQELAAARGETDKNQQEIAIHSAVMTGHGQQMRAFQVALYGSDDAQDSLLDAIRRVEKRLAVLEPDVAEVLRWKRRLSGIGPRLWEAFTDRRVQRTGVGAGLGILATLIIRLVLGA